MEDKTLLRLFGVGTGLTLALMLYVTKPSEVVIIYSVIAGIPSAILGADIAASKSEKRIQKLSEALSSTEERAKKAERRVIDYNRIVEAKYQLERKLEGLQQEIIKLESNVTSLVKERDTRQQIIQYLQADKDSLEKQVTSLKEEYDELAVNFDELIESAVSERVGDYKHKDRKQLLDKFKANHSQGLAVVGQADVIAKKSEEMVEIIMQRDKQRLKIFQQVKEHTIEAAKAWDLEREGLVEQIELLNIKVARLQQRLAGDLVEPELLSCKFAIPGQIANELAKIIWKGFSIPLSAKGAQLRSNGLIEIGYTYSRNQSPSELVGLLSRHADSLASELGVHKITSVREHDLSPLIVVGLRREPEVNKDTVKLLAGSPEEFIKYLKSNPWRYRLIAKPGTGKTPTTAVMVSQFLKSGMTLGNTGKGRKIPHSHVVVSCPDVMSSQKDTDYPLQPFLKYGDTTAANKSFQDVEKEWKYRKQNTQYAQDISYLMVWDELDNTIKNSSNPKATGEYLVELLRQAHHTGMGWIASGQSVMTSLIPGFKDDDRDLFTEIVIGTGKIRMYLEKYGKKILPDYSVKNLESSLSLLEPYIETQNNRIVDTARELRLALVLDAKSPKLFFLPNLDNVELDYEAISNVSTKMSDYKGQNVPKASTKDFDTSDIASSESITEQPFDTIKADLSNLTIGGNANSCQNPTCPHCGSTDLSQQKDKRFYCKSCKKRISLSKIVWK